jgi:hypothetical protein
VPVDPFDRRARAGEPAYFHGMSSQGDVDRAQRDLEQLHKKQADEARKEADLSEKIARARASMSGTSSASTVRSKMADIARYERDLVHVQKRKADLAKQIGTTITKLGKSQQRVADEQSRDQKRVLDGLRRQQEEFRQVQERHVRKTVELVSREPSLLAALQHDAFISHASEDKDELVRPLAEKLVEAGFDIWYDEHQLTVGDSLRRSIDRGLTGARFGIVVLSPNFFSKNWPQYELDGLVAKEMEGRKVILPLWHKVSKNEVLNYSPSLADKLALNTATHTLDELVQQLAPVLKGGSDR